MSKDHKPELTSEDIDTIIERVEENNLFDDNRKAEIAWKESKLSRSDTDIAVLFVHCHDELTRMADQLGDRKLGEKLKDYLQWFSEHTEINLLRYWVQERNRIRGGIGTYNYEQKMRIKVMVFRLHFLELISTFKKIVKMEDYITVS